MVKFYFLYKIKYFFLIIQKTKTVQVKANETAQEIVNRCKHLFNLESSENSNEQTANQPLTSNYQLWLKTSKNEPLIPLIGR